MSTLRHVRPTRQGLARLGAAFLALALLLPGQAIHAAAAPAQTRPLPRPNAPSAPAVNHKPVAHDDNLVAFDGEEDQPLLVLANDTDPDSGDTLNIFSVATPQHGTINWRGSDFLMYAPDAGYTGLDTFKYVVEDRQPFMGGLTDTGTITVTVVAPGATGTTSSAFAVNACLPSAAGCDTSFWRVIPTSGATSDTGTGACNGAAGLGIKDVYSWNYELDKAFDTGLTVWINNQQFAPQLPMTVTHYSLLTGPVTMSNVRVTVRYDGLIASDSLRTQVSLANATGSPKSITVTLASNLGSDGQTIIAGSSTNDSNFTTADRWVVTSKSGGAPFKLVDTHVLFGPGSPAVTPSAVYTTTFKCDDKPTPNDRGVRADFHVTVPANSTRRLLFFTQVHQTSADALTDAAEFNGEPIDLLSGLPSNQFSQVVNWDLKPILRDFLPLLYR